MRAAFVVWFIVIGLLSGCSRERPFHGDVSFTQEERAAVEIGLAFFLDHAGLENPGIVWDVEDHSCEDFHVVRGTEGGGFYEHGRCLWIGVIEPDRIASIAAHELAHHYGLTHVEGDGSLMSSYPALAWTPADEAECRRVGVCAPE